jgi:hypothetical protein
MSDQIERASTEVDVLVPEVWSSNFYETLLASLPFKDIINKDYEGEISNLGDTVKISTVPEFGEATEFSEDQRVDADAVTVTQQSLVINKQVAKDFIVTNKALLQSLPFVDKLRDLAIYAIMKKIENGIIALLIPSASAPDHSIAFDSGTTLGLADMLEGKELMDAQDIPGPDRHMVVGSAQLNDIFNITGFTSSDFLLAGAPLASGQIPSQLLGFSPHFTTLVGNVVYLIHKSAATIAFQKGMSTNKYDLGVDGKRAIRVNSDVLYGQKLLDNTRIVTIG